MRSREATQILRNAARLWHVLQLLGERRNIIARNNISRKFLVRPSLVSRGLRLISLLT
jgi:hypothetical protein